MTYRQVKEPADAVSVNDDVKNSLPVHVFEEGNRRISPVNGCCLTLWKHYSIKKNKNKKEGKNAENMCFHVRDIDKN